MIDAKTAGINSAESLKRETERVLKEIGNVVLARANSGHIQAIYTIDEDISLNIMTGVVSYLKTLGYTVKTTLDREVVINWKAIIE